MHYFYSDVRSFFMLYVGINLSSETSSLMFQIIINRINQKVLEFVIKKIHGSAMIDFILTKKTFRLEQQIRIRHRQLYLLLTSNLGLSRLT